MQQNDLNSILDSTNLDNRSEFPNSALLLGAVDDLYSVIKSHSAVNKELRRWGTFSTCISIDFIGSDRARANWIGSVKSGNPEP